MTQSELDDRRHWRKGRRGQLRQLPRGRGKFLVPFLSVMLNSAEDSKMVLPMGQLPSVLPGSALIVKS